MNLKLKLKFEIGWKSTAAANQETFVWAREEKTMSKGLLLSHVALIGTLISYPDQYTSSMK